MRLNNRQNMKTILLSLVLSFSFVTIQAQTAPANSPVAIHGALKTKGNKVLDEHDKVTSLAGMSFFWSQWSGQFYNTQCVDWLVSDWNCQIVRAAMGVESNEGYLNFPSVEKQKVFTIVDAAIKNGIYVLIDWHEENAIYHQNDAIAFFKEMAMKYGSYPNVIYEIYNEPVQYDWSSKLKPYSQALVDEIRKIDPDNLIIIGNRDWDQHPVECANDQVIGTNLAYTLHFYVGTHSQSLRDEATAALNKGIPLFVTEWGVWGSDAELDTWVTFMRDNNLSWCNWAINTKVEPSSALGPNASGTGNWPDADLTSIGYRVRDYIRGWNPKPCTTVRSAYKTMSIPGTIEAEDYDNGCAETVYHETESANKGGKYRTDAVDIEACTDANAGFNVGYIENGEWLEYTLSSVKGGTFDITARVASFDNVVTKSMTIIIDGKLIATIPVSNTGGWQTWQTISIKNINIPSGTNSILRLEFVGGLFNLNNITFTQTSSNQILQFQQGWNLFSTNIQSADNSIATLFNGLDVREVKTMDAFWLNGINPIFNSLQNIEVGKGYLVYMNTAGTLTITGTELTLGFAPLKSGWNLIGSPSSTTKSINQSDYPNATIIKDFDSYWSSNGGGTLQNWNPSNAYFIKSK